MKDSIKKWIITCIVFIIIGFLLLFLISCKTQSHPYYKPVKTSIERIEGKKKDIYIIREISCGNHKDRYKCYIHLPLNYESISQDSLNNTNLTGFIRHDTLYINFK